MRDVADEGLLYTFDPIASLQLRVILPPRGSTEVRLVDGYAADEHVAAAAIASHLRRAPPDFAKPGGDDGPHSCAPQQSAAFARLHPALQLLRGRQGAGDNRHDAATLGPRACQPAGPRRGSAA